MNFSGLTCHSINYIHELKDLREVQGVTLSPSKLMATAEHTTVERTFRLSMFSDATSVQNRQHPREHKSNLPNLIIDTYNTY